MARSAGPGILMQRRKNSSRAWVAPDMLFAVRVGSVLRVALLRTKNGCVC